MKSLSEIKITLEKHKDILYGKYPIKSLAIFGSYSRNENTNHSDVDLLVDFKERIGIRFIDLANELENIIGIKVDLVSKNGVKEKYLDVITPDLIYV